MTVSADDGAGCSTRIGVAFAVTEVDVRPGAATNLNAAAKEGLGSNCPRRRRERWATASGGNRVQ